MYITTEYTLQLAFALVAYMEIVLLAAILITLLGGGAIVLWIAGIAFALWMLALLWTAFADHIGRPIVVLMDRLCGTRPEICEAAQSAYAEALMAAEKTCAEAKQVAWKAYCEDFTPEADRTYAEALETAGSAFEETVGAARSVYNHTLNPPPRPKRYVRIGRFTLARTSAVLVVLCAIAVAYNIVSMVRYALG